MLIFKIYGGRGFYFKFQNFVGVRGVEKCGNQGLRVGLGCGGNGCNALSTSTPYKQLLSMRFGSSLRQSYSQTLGLNIFFFNGFNYVLNPAFDIFINHYILVWLYMLIM